MRALAIAIVLVAGASDGTPLPDRDFAVRCGKLYRGEGPPLRDAWLIVRGGRVQQVLESGAGAPPAELPVIDASDKVVMPGIVAADTDLSRHGDAEYNVTPDFQALDGFDFLRPYRRALAGGVTTAYLAPGRTRLVPGQGSVVKLWGDDIVERVLSESCCLRITLGSDSTSSPALFEPTPHPTADDPLLPARKQYPSARISQLAVLRQLFAEAGLADGELQGPGSAENRYEAAALRRVVAGELPLRVAARDAADIRRAVQLAQELGARACVLEDPSDIGPVAAAVARAGAIAVFRMPVRISDSNPGGENRQDKRTRSRPENAGIAARAGIKVALAPPANDALVDYLMVAGMAVRYGLDADRALAAITSTAAEAIGVADRVGTLSPGKDADFLVLSGEPFAIGTMVERTFVGGRVAYARESDSGLLAVRTGRIITLEGNTLTNGVLIAGPDGRIRGIGEDLAIPYGARVVDLPGAVMVPGLVDSFSSLGLAGDGTDVPNGAADQRIADVVRHDDPGFATAVRAGVTTLLLSGKDSGTVSGRIAAVKTGAPDERSAVLRAIAGVRFVHDNVDADGAKPLADALQRGKQYIEAWQKYEKALADFKAGKGEKPKEEAPAPAAPPEDPISGTWELTISTEAPFELGIVLTLKLDGTKVTGQARMKFGSRELPAADIESGTFERGRIRIELRAMGGSAVVEGTVTDETMSGTFEAANGQLRGTFEGRRTSKDASAAAAVTTGDGEPRKPKVDESLEPIRAILEKRATAVVRTDRAPAIRDVIALCEKEQIEYVLHGCADAVETPDILGDKPPDVLLGPALVEWDGERAINAAGSLAQRGVRVAFGTGDAAGSAYLPVHAAHAIRYGMDPDTALRAMTIDAARMFGLDDRIGSLKRGKDADFVVFSGNPFDLTSRVLLVVCHGRIAYDARGEEGR